MQTSPIHLHVLAGTRSFGVKMSEVYIPIIITTGCMGNNSVALIASFKIFVSLDSISGKQNY